MRIILLFILVLICTGCPQRRVTRTVALAGFPEGYATIFPSIAVSLNGNTLEFSVADRPRLTLEAKQILKAVRTELRTHYGAEKVKTQR